MATAVGGKILKDREQWQRRRSMVKQDQWGRRWHCEVDMFDPGLTFCGVPTLDGRYKPPPVDIPSKYFKRQDPDEPLTLKIDVRQWRRDTMAAIAQWNSRLGELARLMYPNDFGQVLANPTSELLRQAGPMPIPVEFIEAIEAGNKWVLGIPRADGTAYPRPPWATDELMERYQVLRRSHWSVDGVAADRPVDATKYADVEDETSAGVVGVSEEDEAETVSVPRGAGGKFVSRNKRP